MSFQLMPRKEPEVAEAAKPRLFTGLPFKGAKTPPVEGIVMVFVV